MNSNTVDFLNSFGCEYEINNLYKKLSLDEVTDLENIYFVAGDGVSKTKMRCDDDDVEFKTYFSIDIDLKELLKINLSEEDIEWHADDIVELIKDDQVFKDWSWIVMS
jgi:hypothetical protein